MRAAGASLVTAILATLVLSAAPAAAQSTPAPRFDLKDWDRRPSDDGALMLFECDQKVACGEDSKISARLGNLPREPWTVERQRTRETEIIKRMREQGEGRVKDIVLGETRTTKIEELSFIYTEKKYIPVKGADRTDIAGILTGKTKQYIIISSAARPEQARNNILGFARIAALVLDQVARDTNKGDKADKPEPK